MSRLIDLTGQRFGRLVAIERVAGHAADGDAVWRFQCDCGQEIATAGRAVRRGRTTSCGCQKLEGMCRISEHRRADADQVLLSIAESPTLTSGGHAQKMGWLLKSGDPYKDRVSRAARVLEKAGLVTKSCDSAPAGSGRRLTRRRGRECLTYWRGWERLTYWRGWELTERGRQEVARLRPQAVQAPVTASVDGTERPADPSPIPLQTAETAKAAPVLAGDRHREAVRNRNREALQRFEQQIRSGGRG
jgi:hypothetical protein